MPDVLLDLKPTITDKATQLATLRAERKQLVIDVQALQGQGWEDDVRRAKRQDLPPFTEDVSAVLAGKPLALAITTVTVQDLQRRLRALDAAIAQLAKDVNTATVGRLQQEATPTVAALATELEGALSLVNKLVTSKARVRPLLVALQQIQIEYDQLRAETPGLPVLTYDGTRAGLAEQLLHVLDIAEVLDKAATAAKVK